MRPGAAAPGSPLRALPFLALLTWGPGCTPTPEDSAAPAALDRVVLLTVDALSPRILWGDGGQWDTAPRMRAFMDEGVVLRNVLSPRALTAVALTSLSTGSYPRDHGLRVNASARPRRTTLPERFQAAGYLTLGYSANLCYVWDYGVDERVCTWSGEEEGASGLAARDDALVEQLLARLPSIEDGQRVFLWLHLNQPHRPFEPVEPYYQEFHPEPYTGDLDVSDTAQTDLVAVGQLPFDAEDRRHMEAVYASQVRAVDDNLGRVLDALAEAGWLDDALVVFGADHSEELAEHADFFYHGCPPYDDTLGIAFAFHQPARLPAGLVIEDWVSNVDIAPTIAELSGAFPWTGQQVGRSLAASLRGAPLAAEPVFLERGVQTAGVLLGTDKYIMSGQEGTSDCAPYNELGGSYPGELDELYDLERDPDEHTNLADTHTTTRDSLRTALCTWILASDWVEWEDVSENLLLPRCDAWMAR
ncbi:MAG: sulfatase-like hydrolase/transferase [Pseudomonadota bacterium]